MHQNNLCADQIQTGDVAAQVAGVVREDNLTFHDTDFFIVIVFRLQCQRSDGALPWLRTENSVLNPGALIHEFSIFFHKILYINYLYKISHPKNGIKKAIQIALDGLDGSYCRIAQAYWPLLFSFKKTVSSLAPQVKD